jgi:spore germination protein YaaH
VTNKDFYTVQSNDTLFGISRRTGVPVSELAKLNGVRNPNRIEVGERLALNRQAVCGVNLQFLDRDHNPLRDLSYVIRYCGKEV